MIYIVPLFILVALAITVPLSSYMIRVSRRFGLIDTQGPNQLHKRGGGRVPNTGGIAVFWAVVTPMALGMVAIWVVPLEFWQNNIPAIAVHRDGLRRMSGMGGAILTAVAIIHMMGLYDDRRPLGPMFKLAIELTVAAALVLLADMRILDFLATRYGAAGMVLSVLASVAWIVVVTNAFNMLDNMDGLSAGVATICASLYLISTLIGGQWFVALVAALLVGALLGFLLFNYPPAKLYLGDGGSLVIGLLIAIISIRTTYFGPRSIVPDQPGAWYGVLMPLMVLAIPLYDFVSVTLIRLARGRMPWQGDQQHFSHRLVQLGMTRHAAVLVVWLCTLATGLAGVMLGSLTKWQAVIAGLQTLTILMLLAVLEWGARRSGKASGV